MNLKGYTNVRYGESRINPLRKLRALILLSSFAGRHSDIYRAVHFLRDNDFFFANYAKEFFYRTHKLLLKKQIREVRRLLVYTSENEINLENSQRIIKFHTQTYGYECRLISSSEYQKLQHNFNIHPAIDFGVFGEQRVYRARTDRPDFVIGTWSRRKSEVIRYLNLFDASWNSPNTIVIGDIDTTNLLTLEDLFIYQSKWILPVLARRILRN